MSHTVGLMSLDDRVLHIPGPVHGYTQCGIQARDPWKCGPAQDLVDSASFLCDYCWDVWED